MANPSAEARIVVSLRENVQRLSYAYFKMHAEFRMTHPTFEPEQVTDHNGRPILLDALTALVNGLAALHRYDESQCSG